MRILLCFCLSIFHFANTLKADGTGDHPLQLKEKREGQYEALVQRTKMYTETKIPQLASTAKVEKAWLVLAPWFNISVNPDMLELKIKVDGNNTRTINAPKLDRDEVEDYAHSVYLLDVTNLINEGIQTFSYSYQGPIFELDEALVILYEDQINLPYREIYLFFGSENLRRGASSSMKFDRLLPDEASGSLKIFMTADDDNQNSTLIVNNVKIASGTIFGPTQRGSNPTADFSVTLTNGSQEIAIATNDWLSLNVAVIYLEPPVSR